MRTAFFALALLPLAGCASTPAAVPAGTTGQMSLRVRPDYGRVSSASEMNVRVSGESVCMTTDCQAKGLRLTFSNISRQQVQIRILPASITAGARTFDIPAADLPQGIETMPQGPFLSTLIPARFVEALATEQDVRVNFGSTTFTFSHADRAPLRALLASMQPTT